MRSRVVHHHRTLGVLVVLAGLIAFLAWTAGSRAQTPIPHPGPQAPGEAGEFQDCLACHQAGVNGASRLAGDHLGRGNEDCLVCHQYMVEPEAARPHSALLTGKHAELWCRDCHAEAAQPEYECANCHQASAQPHFGETCQDCHTTEGFDQVNLGDFQHPTPLAGEHAALDCVDCHAADQSQPAGCAACHQPPENHPAGTCAACHTAEGWAESAASIVAQAPRIRHTLGDQADCLLCHDPAGPIRPAPADHAGFTPEQCGLCHQGLPTIEEMEAAGVRTVEECYRCH